MSIAAVWIAVGFLGQAMFSARFLVQWLVSEKQRRSVVPMAFWYLSIGGGSIMLSYAIWRQDPVFITGQAAGLIVYFRNLRLISNESRRSQDEAVAIEAPA